MEDRSVSKCNQPYDEAKAAQAYNEYRALALAFKAAPSLMENECFQILLSDAYSAFYAAFNRGYE